MKAVITVYTSTAKMNVLVAPGKKKNRKNMKRQEGERKKYRSAERKKAKEIYKYWRGMNNENLKYLYIHLFSLVMAHNEL